MARWSSAHASRYYHLLTKVAELGHDVFVLQPPSRGSIEANDIDVTLQGHPRVHVTTVSISPWFWNARFPLEKLVKKMYYSLRCRPYVKRMVSKDSVDLLYLYNLPQAIYLFGKRPRVVFDLADDLLGMLKTELSITEQHPLYRLAARCLNWMIKQADVVICISGPLFERIVHPRKYIIPNGANLPADGFPVQPTGKHEPRKLLVGYVGAFEYSMALDLVVDAALRLPDVNFVLIGAGREYPRIASLVRERKLRNVELTGALPHDEAMRIISGTDICLNLFVKSDVSHAVSPLKLFEYLSFKKPVISTRLREIERINRDFLYFGDTVEELVDAIRHIATHKEEALAKAQRGYEAVASDFSWGRIAQDFLTAVSFPSAQ